MNNLKRSVTSVFLILIFVFSAFLMSSCGSKLKKESKIYIVSEESFKSNVQLVSDTEIDTVSLKKINKDKQERLSVGEKYYALVYLYDTDVFSASLEFSGSVNATVDDTVIIGSTGDNKLSISETSENGATTFSRKKSGKENHYLAVGFTVYTVDETTENYNEPNLKITFSYKEFDIKEYVLTADAFVLMEKQASSALSVHLLDEKGENYSFTSAENKTYMYPYEKLHVSIECRISSSLNVDNAGNAVMTISTVTNSGAIVSTVVEELPTSDYTQDDKEIKARFKVYGGEEEGKVYKFSFYLYPHTNKGYVALTVKLTGEDMSISGDKTYKNTFYINESMREEPKLEYVLSDDGNYYIIAGLGEETGDKIRIPDRHNGKQVTRIGENAFLSDNHLKEVILPETLSVIGANAFKGCTGLDSIVIPASVREIGINAFADCPNVALCCEAESKQSKWNYLWAPRDTTVFWNCKSIFKFYGSKEYIFMLDTDKISSPKLIIPETYLGFPVARADKVNSSNAGIITSLKIPASLTLIESDTFTDFTALSEITVAEGNPVYKSVNNCLIKKDSKKLVLACNTSVIPEDGSVIYINEDAFSYTSFNNSSNWENGALYIGNTLIKVKSSEVTGDFSIKEGTVRIADGALSGCSEITGITLPSSLKIIGYYAFSNCSSIKNMTLPDGLTNIGPSAFESCSKLKALTVPSNVKNIMQRTFMSCELLTDIVLSNGLESIGDYAFSDCKSLSSITLPATVTSIGNNVFSGCTKLVSITIPSGVTDIGEGVFTSCKSLTSIEVAQGNTEYKSVDGNLYTADGKTLLAYATGKSDTAFTVPSGVSVIDSFAFCAANLTQVTLPLDITEIKKGAFTSCYGLASVNLPDGLSSIEEYAFSSCTSLKSIVVPNSVLKMGNNVFNGCTSLESVTLADGMTMIDYSMFSGCTSLTSVIIPKSITLISGYVFENCTALSKINYKGSQTQWGKIIKREMWDGGSTKYSITYNFK